jgi:8-oxo-dGTP pyrophosphatase MutT (NUDIX family)
MKYIDKLAWIHIADKKILSTRSKGKDTYYIPGGKREGEETDHDALCREIREELSIELKQDELKYIETFEAQAHGKTEGVVVRMTCYEGPYLGTLMPASEIDEIAWLTHVDKNKSSAVDNIIFDWLKEKYLII